MKTRLLALVSLGSALALGPAWGCAVHGTDAGSTSIVWTGETADARIGLITITDNRLVPPDHETVCVCGIGLGSAANPLPARTRVNRVAIIITSAPPRESQNFTPFAFATSATMTNGLQRVASETSSSGNRPLFAGSTWFGFASNVAPFRLPRLRAGQQIAFQYEISVPKSALPFTLDVQFAAGEGRADGSPEFAGDHPVTFFAAGNRSVTLASPAPAAVAPLRAAPTQPQRQPNRTQQR